MVIQESTARPRSNSTKIADQPGQLLDAGIIYRRGPVRQILALAAVRQGVRLVKPSRALPKVLMIQECHLRPLKVVQRQPGREQCVRLGLLHGGEVQIAEQPPPLKVACEQGIGFCRKKFLVE
jgi:hypothetical protein